MKTNLLLTVLAFSLTAAFVSPAFGADTAGADHILRQMSAKISAARQFSFEAHREIDAALLNGRDMPESADIEVTVQRPNKVVAISESKEGVRHFHADGQTVSLLDAKMNLYATVPMRTSLDGLVEKIDEKYGFTPPLAEFVVSDPYKDIMRQVHRASYLGLVTFHTGFLNLASVQCHRIALSGNLADVELWVAVNDQLPRKLVATFKDRAGKPQLKVEFSEWNLAAKVTGREFSFVPPKGATKIPMRTTAEMESAIKEAEHKKQ